MAEIVKITKGQPFVLYVPLVILNGDGSKEAVEAASLSDVTVKMLNACEESSATYNTFERYLVLDLPATLNTGVYAVVITATLPQGRQFALRIKRAFEVVDWDSQSNWRDYIVGDHIELTDQPFIAGVFATDADIERLKEELRQQKAAAAQAQAEAEAAKAEYDRKAAELDGVAQQGTLTEGVAAIRDDISHVDIDTTTLAKESQVKDGNDTAISVSKEVRSEVGTSSDTAAETGTLAAVLKWTKNKIKDIYNALTDSTNGLSAIKTSAASAATDAAAAKTAAQNAETTAQGAANKNEILAAIEANAGIPTLTIPDSTAAQELAPNTLYIFATRTSTLTLTLGTPTVGIANEYHFFVVCGATAPTVNFPSGITWNGGSAPTIAADKTYEVSILNNVAAYFEV